MKKTKSKSDKWGYPTIKEGALTKYNWMVHNVNGLQLGFKI